MEVEKSDLDNFRRNIRLKPKTIVNEDEIQKKLVKLILILNNHSNTWSAIILEASGPLRGLTNLAEQLRSVEKAKIDHLEDFSEIQDALIARILNTIEDELALLMELIEKLNKSTSALKSALYDLEKSTEHLDFNSNSTTVTGSATQPSLSTILQDGLEILTLYSDTTEEIRRLVRKIDFRDEELMNKFNNTLQTDFCSNKILLRLLATTQYLEDKANNIL